MKSREGRQACKNGSRKIVATQHSNFLYQPYAKGLIHRGCDLTIRNSIYLFSFTVFVQRSSMREKVCPMTCIKLKRVCG